MIFLERGRELIAAQVVEKEMLLLLLIDIILVVWGCSVNMYIVPFFLINLHPLRLPLGYHADFPCTLAIFSLASFR